MIRIGFVDYYLSEWHANNYPAWLAEASGKLGTDAAVAFAWAERDVSPVDGRTTDEWCKAFGAERTATLEELCEKADCIAILAPSDPEKHPAYASAVLPFGKPTFVDKTFAPDLATAQAIFALARRSGTPLYSSSALRYAAELAGLEGTAHSALLLGGGSSVEEYIVHQLEMLVKLFGVGARRVKCAAADDRTTCTVDYCDGRIATLVCAPCLPFAVTVAGKDGESRWLPIASDFFRASLVDMLRFFRDGTPSFDPAETLEAMKIRDGLLRAAKQEDTWLSL